MLEKASNAKLKVESGSWCSLPNSNLKGVTVLATNKAKEEQVIILHMRDDTTLKIDYSSVHLTALLYPHVVAASTADLSFVLAEINFLLEEESYTRDVRVDATVLFTRNTVLFLQKHILLQLYIYLVRLGSSCSIWPG